MQAVITVGEKAVSAAMRDADLSLISGWRGQIPGAGLGTRLGNSIRLANFLKSGDSLNAAALVWSNTPGPSVRMTPARCSGPKLDSSWRSSPRLRIPRKLGSYSTRSWALVPRQPTKAARAAAVSPQANGSAAPACACGPSTVTEHRASRSLRGG